MSTTEHTTNDAIANALRPTRHGWSIKGVVRSENTGTLAGSNKRPDILITEANVSPVVIETEILPAIIPHDKALYRQRHKVENMFGKLKDWRRIHTRYDRCAHAFMSAICIAATVIFWINQ